MAFVLLAPFIRINVLLVAFIRINVLLVTFGRIDVLMVMYNCTHGNINALCGRFIKLDKLLFGCSAIQYNITRKLLLLFANSALDTVAAINLDTVAAINLG